MKDLEILGYLLFGQINNVSSFDISNNAMNTPPIVGNTSSDLNPEEIL